MNTLAFCAGLILIGIGGPWWLSERVSSERPAWLLIIAGCVLDVVAVVRALP